MTAALWALLVVGIGLHVLCICLLAERVRKLTEVVRRDHARLDHVQKLATDTNILARRRLTAGRSGR